MPSPVPTHAPPSPPPSPSRHSYDLLVGADGSGSAVRKALQAAHPGRFDVEVREGELGEQGAGHTQALCWLLVPARALESD